MNLLLEVTGSHKCVIDWFGNKWKLPGDSGTIRRVTVDEQIGNIAIGDESGDNMAGLTIDNTATYAYAPIHCTYAPIYNNQAMITGKPGLNVEHDTTKDGSMIINGIIFSWRVETQSRFGLDGARDLDV